MKKYFLVIALVSFSAEFSLAQVGGAILAENARTALAAYNRDPVNSAAKLAEAINLIEEALKTPDAQTLMSVWLTKGNIYSTRLESDMMKRVLNPKMPLTGDNDAFVAFDAYNKVYRLSQINNEKSDAIKGISKIQVDLVNIGYEQYEGMAYEKSFLSLRAGFESHELLKQNGYPSLPENEQQIEGMVYVIAMAATQANRCNDAVVFYDKLYAAGTSELGVYEGLYHCKQQLGDDAGALRVLTEGRKKFPNDTGLLFTEINLYLRAGKLNELTTRLEQAIKQEPANVSLYVTLGNVYDNLYQSALRSEDVPNANVYFEQAKRYYSTGLLKDPNHLDAAFSFGALYYNKATVRTQLMNALPEDYSKKGIAALSVLRTEVMALFDEAVPYFKKAESINPNDVSTLSALLEIYSIKEEVEIEAEMKRRLEVVKSGGNNPSSYFK